MDLTTRQVIIQNANTVNIYTTTSRDAVDGDGQLEQPAVC